MSSEGGKLVLCPINCDIKFRLLKSFAEQVSLYRFLGFTVLKAQVAMTSQLFLA